MIVDSSALVAILQREPDAAVYEAAIALAPRCRMSVANLLETAIVIERRGGDAAGDRLDSFLAAAAIHSAPVTPDQVVIARRAWRRFGKGRHPARLNYGDCFAYALAWTTGEPLLFKGNDFALTDVPLALRG